MNSVNIAQHILAIDARYSNYRIKEPQFKTLYIRRRSQLLTENAKKEHEPSIRRQYLNVRKQLLAKKYGTLAVTESLRSHSIGLRSRNSSIIDSSYDNLAHPAYDGFRPTHRRYHSGSSSRNWGSVGSLKMMTMSETIPDELICENGEGVVPTKKASASRAMAGNTSLSENYAFSGMYHIFDQHADAVTSIKFAHNERYLLACSSMDGTLSLCSLNPPKVMFMLLGHKKSVNDFDWSITNDLIVSASSDCTTRIWDANTGQNIRILNDQFNCAVIACRFTPMNNNLIVTGNQKGIVQVYNMSTGKCIKGGIAKGTASIKCLEFDPSGSLLWTGDEKGVVTSYLFNIMTGKLTRGKRIMIKENHCVTSISARTWVSREARDPSLLISCACNSLLLYRIINSDGDLQKKTSFNIQHSEYGIRSSFCPLTSFRQGACVVSGSEDKSVYFFNIDEPNLPLNTLLGHSSPVIDVCWNYDESLLASCDVEGSVIIWKRVQ